MTNKLHNAVQRAQKLYPHENQLWKRQIVVDSMITPKPSDEVQEKIDFHLRALSALESNQGIDSTPHERLTYYKSRAWHMEAIKDLHEPYYMSIKIQEPIDTAVSLDHKHKTTVESPADDSNEGLIAAGKRAIKGKFKIKTKK